MTQRYEELIALLRRLFQLDRPDLDFGLYRGPWTPRWASAPRARASSHTNLSN